MRNNDGGSVAATGAIFSTFGPGRTRVRVLRVRFGSQSLILSLSKDQRGVFPGIPASSFDKLRMRRFRSFGLDAIPAQDAPDLRLRGYLRKQVSMAESGHLECW